MKMETKIDDRRYGPYKTHLTLVTALQLMTLPVVVVVGDHRWIIADKQQKHLDALIRLWKLVSDMEGKHSPAWVEQIPKETVDHLYERNKG